MATSAVAGAEGLIRASRSALIQYISGKEPGSSQEALVSLLQGLSTVLSDNLQDDRYAIPTVEILAFVLGGYIHHIPGGSEALYAPSNKSRNTTDQPSLRRIFVLVQKAHFKSSNMARLEAAIKVYGPLARVAALRMEVLKKITGMLLHPFPRVCLESIRAGGSMSY